MKRLFEDGVKRALNEMKNTEEPEMIEDYTGIPMRNTERDDFPNRTVSALGELYLVGFIFVLNIKFSP